MLDPEDDDLPDMVFEHRLKPDAKTLASWARDIEGEPEEIRKLLEDDRNDLTTR